MSAIDESRIQRRPVNIGAASLRAESRVNAAQGVTAHPASNEGCGPYHGATGLCPSDSCAVTSVRRAITRAMKVPERMSHVQRCSAQSSRWHSRSQ